MWDDFVEQMIKEKEEVCLERNTSWLKAKYY